MEGVEPTPTNFNPGSLTLLGKVERTGGSCRWTGSGVCNFTSVLCSRYLFALQVRRDIATGQMPCQEHTAVLLCSFIVQCEYFFIL